GDRLGEERQGEEHRAQRPSPAEEGEERSQVERRREERGARPHVVDGLRVEGRQGEEERGRGGRKARLPGGAALPSRPPHVVAYEHEHEQRGHEVEEQVRTW